MTKRNGNKKQIVFMIFLVLFVALFVAGYLVIDRQTGKKVITISDKAPDFRLPSSEGKYISLAGLRGKVVIVHFWATWCPPCVEEIPTLDKMYRQFVGEDFEMLAISVNEGGAEEVVPFIRENRLSFPVLFDPERATSGLYGTYKFPETYVVDRKGVVRYKMIGSRDWTDPDAIRILRELIAAK